MNERTEFTFISYSDYENGKMAHIDTDDFPLNVFIDNADEIEVEKGGRYAIKINGVSYENDVYETEEEHRNSGNGMASESLIPVGTFPAGDDKDFSPSPYILFSGKVIIVYKNPDAGEDGPNYFLRVKTYGITFNLYTRYDGEIKEGYYVHGVAWLYGNIEEI